MPNRPTDPPPPTEYATHHKVPTAPRPPVPGGGDWKALSARLDVLGSALNALISDESDTEMPEVDPNEDPAITNARIRVNRLRNQATVSARKATNRGRWITVLLALVSVLGMVSSNLYSYVRGYISDATARALEAESAKEMHVLVEQHETRLAEIVERERRAGDEIEAELKRVGELQALQSAYLTEVLTAISSKRKVPPKSLQLVQAEASALARVPPR